MAAAKGLLDLIALLRDRRTPLIKGGQPVPEGGPGRPKLQPNPNDNPDSPDENKSILSILSKLPTEMLAELFLKVLQKLTEKDQPNQEPEGLEQDDDENEYKPPYGCCHKPLDIPA